MADQILELREIVRPHRLKAPRAHPTRRILEVTAYASTRARLTIGLDADELATTALSGNGDLLRTWAKAALAAIPADPVAAQVIGALSTNLAERSDYHKYLRAATTALSGASAELSDANASFEEDARAWNELYREINSAVGRNAPLDTFLQELDLRSKEPPLGPGVIPLLTIHGSKGNEFNHVYLLGLAEDILPSFQSKKRGDHSPQMEEERRMLIGGFPAN